MINKILISLSVLIATVATSQAVTINFNQSFEAGANTIFAYTVDWEGAGSNNTGVIGFTGLSGVTGGIVQDGSGTPAADNSSTDWSVLASSSEAIAFTFDGTQFGGTTIEGFFGIIVPTAEIGVTVDDEGIISWATTGSLGGATGSGTVIGPALLAVPEPATVALLLGGAVLAFTAYRRRK